MSNDLISRKVLFDELSSLRIELNGISCRKEFKKTVKEVLDCVKHVVEDQPTAFDKEKVIAEMNETKNIVEAKIKKAYVTRDEVSFYLNSGASDMAVEFIDIVKKGGIE